ncbi:MAG: PAS domain-containing protein [Campylobacterota bacterium]|nr:PAS domain-containing protein [Campylobacterota bacterium]
MKEKIDINSLKSNILKIISIIFVALLTIVLLIILNSQNNNINSQNKNINKSIHNSINYTIQHSQQSYQFILKRVVNTDNIIEYIINQDRESLYKILKSKFDLLQQENEYFKTLHIINSDGKSFLRVHKKDEYGDDIASKRLMVRDIMKNHKLIYGYETGIHTTSFRVMMPIFDNGKFIASVGIGIDPNYFIARIGEIIDEDGALFVNNDNLNLYSNNQDFNIGKYILQTPLIKNNLNILKELPKNYNFEDATVVKKADKRYMIHTHSVKGFDNKEYAKYIFIQDITKMLELRENTRFFILFTISIFAFIIYFVLRFFLNRFKNEVDDFYNNTINTIKFDEAYRKSVEDNSSNIIVTSLGKELFSANRRFFEFSGFDSVKEFRKEYSSICDLFVKRDGFLQKDNNGLYWVEYIVKNPDIIHKAIMKKDEKEYIFHVTSSELDFDDKIRCVATFSDITEIELIKERYELAINGTSDGLWDLDISTNKTYFSPRWKEMLGYSEYEIENSFFTWLELLHPDDLEQASKDIDKAITKQKEKYENIHRLKHKDGHWVWILNRGKVVFNDEGKAIRMVGFHTDITKQKEIGAKVKKQEELMIAQSRHAAMGEMISMIAHQWRQPLSVISMGANNIMADVELEMVDNDSLKDYAMEISQQTQELSKTIDDFKDFFKPMKGSEIVTIEEVLTDALKVIGKSLFNNNIKLTLNCNSKIKLETFSRELMQVFINIIKNAKEALLENSIKNPEIIIETEDSNKIISIKICDNAGGIDKEIIENIFNPYFTTKNEKNGTGLGLYISKTIVEKHLAGKLDVCNKENGVCFDLELNTSISDETQKKGN